MTPPAPSVARTGVTCSPGPPPAGTPSRLQNAEAIGAWISSTAASPTAIRTATRNPLLTVSPLSDENDLPALGEPGAAQLREVYPGSRTGAVGKESRPGSDMMARILDAVDQDRDLPSTHIEDREPHRRPLPQGVGHGGRSLGGIRTARLDAGH